MLSMLAYRRAGISRISKDTLLPRLGTRSQYFQLWSSRHSSFNAGESTTSKWNGVHVLLKNGQSGIIKEEPRSGWFEVHCLEAQRGKNVSDHLIKFHCHRQCTECTATFQVQKVRQSGFQIVDVNEVLKVR